MRITISGIPGSGKTTVAKELAKRLNLKHYYMGGIRRKLAKEKGMTLDEFNKLGEKDPYTDKIVDDYLVKLGKTEDNFIAEGRTAAYFIPNSIKIFMDVDLYVGAERILKDIHEKGKQEERNEIAAQNIEEEVKRLEDRINSDKLRYKKYYNIDIFDRKMYDIWIDTSYMTSNQVIDKILEEIRKL